MKYAKTLSQAEIITLHEMHKNASRHRLRLRALIILMSNRGLTINQIALALDLDRDTVSSSITAWDSIGIMGLYDGDRSGRPSIFDENDKIQILSEIEKEPRRLKVISSAVEKITGKKSSTDTIKRIAKQRGLIWKRVKKSPLESQTHLTMKSRKKN